MQMDGRLKASELCMYQEIKSKREKKEYTWWHDMNISAASLFLFDLQPFPRVLYKKRKICQSLSSWFLYMQKEVKKKASEKKEN